MNWTTPRDLKAQLSRLWERGDLLQPLVTNEAIFPLQLKLKGPGSADLTERFETVRAWIAKLTAMPQIRIECAKSAIACKVCSACPNPCGSTRRIARLRYWRNSATLNASNTS